MIVFYKGCILTFIFFLFSGLTPLLCAEKDLSAEHCVNGGYSDELFFKMFMDELSGDFPNVSGSAHSTMCAQKSVASAGDHSLAKQDSAVPLQVKPQGNLYTLVYDITQQYGSNFPQNCMLDIVHEKGYFLEYSGSVSDKMTLINWCKELLAIYEYIDFKCCENSHSVLLRRFVFNMILTERRVCDLGYYKRLLHDITQEDLEVAVFAQEIQKTDAFLVLQNHVQHLRPGL